ncbi:hypothetical protein [Nonomuraea sp. NPDC049646]|uniref:hypothetical protein n=1 Tax=unclassified Nonomuraea TaxID=2593643 RepID=UPI003794B0AD
MFDEFPEPARSQLAAAFAEGSTRPEWCLAEGRARLAFRAPFAGADLPPDPGRLTYRPARDLRPDEVLALPMRVSEGSLDHDTQVEPATAGAAQEARWMYDDLLNRKAKPGVRRIVAGTDVGDTPTANAFLHAGYSEVGRLCRYYWRAS